MLMLAKESNKQTSACRWEVRGKNEGTDAKKTSMQRWRREGEEVKQVVGDGRG